MGVLKHGGAAGGVSAGLHALLNARLVNGIDHFLKVTDFSRKLAKTDLIITGEGSLDEQTLHGKGPVGVAKMAKEHSLPVIGMAGKVTADKGLQEYFDKLICINDEGEELEISIKNTYSNLERAAHMLGDQLENGNSLLFSNS
jgi:glycerate kinase